MSASLVGSEMCIRDRFSAQTPRAPATSSRAPARSSTPRCGAAGREARTCLLYTSDAADDM
eukprot:3398992-Alexandrium_andersonii.AAC.1